MEKSRNPNGLIITLIAILLMASSFFFLTSNAEADPPQSGNWYIFGTESYSDRILVVNGSLYVTNGSRLNLDNVTLLMNSTSDGQFKLKVNSTGELYANNTVITSYNPAFKFRFEVYGNLTMNYSGASEMWGSLGEPFAGGIQVYGGNLSLYHTTVTNSNGNGIHLVNGRANISHSDVINNQRHELYALDSPYLNISYSDFTDYVTGVLARGITIENSPYLYLSHSNIKGHVSSGLKVYMSPFGVVEHSNLTDNTGGMVIDSTRPAFTLFDNNIFNNAGGGGLISISSNLTISDNLMSGNIGGETIYSSNALIINNAITSIDLDTNSNATIINNTVGSIDLNTNSNARIINNTISGGGIALYDYSHAWIENTIVGFVNAYASDIQAVNSSIGTFSLRWGSHAEILNMPFTGAWLSIDTTGYNLSNPSYLKVRNYLDIRVLNETLMPLSNVDLRVEDNGMAVHKTIGFGGSDPSTDINGEVNWIIVTDRIYHKDFDVPGHPFANISYNVTTVEVKNDSHVFAYNPREAEMLTSHVETFIVDTFPPRISDVVASPAPQEVFGYVNVSANVTDEGNLYGAWLNITGPDASWTNVTMDNISAMEFFHNDTYDTLGTYQFTVWANDTNDNWNYSSGSFLIQDRTGPTISNLNISPKIQDVHGIVNISVNITDNYDVFPTGHINITNPNGAWQNATMQRIGSNYYFNQYCDVIGIYSFTIWVNDSSGNWAFDTGSFTVKDSEKPLLTNIFITPSIQEVHRNVNISVDVADNYELYPIIRININRPDGSSKNYSMFSIGSNYYLNQSYHILGVYSFIIWTRDTSGNWNFSVGAFEITDTAKPEIDAITIIPSLPAQDDYVTISASVKDNYLLSQVRIVIIRPNALISNFSMDYDYTHKTYYFVNTLWTAGDYEFRILAVDSSSNLNSSSGQLRIRDSTPPNIYVISSVSSESTGKDIIVSAYITDNVAVNTVRLYYTDADGVARTGSMSLMDGVYRFTIPGQTSEGTLTYYVWCNDSAGNIVKSSTFEVEILQEYDDNDNPPAANTVLVASLVFLIPIVVFIVIILMLKRRRQF